MSKMMDTDKIGKLAKKLDDRAAAKVQLEEDRAVAAENALDTKINEKADKIYYESLGNSDTLTNDDIVQSSPTGIVMYNRPLNLVDGKKYVVDIIANNENIKFVSPIARTITFVGSNIVAFEKELTIDNVNIYIAVFDTVGISASGNALEYNKNSCSIGYNNISNVTSITFTEIISTEEVNSDLLLNQRFITEEERSKWNNKQDKTDNTLNTEDKTIVGAINELESEVFDITANVISMDAYKADKTYVDEQISNITNNNITEAELDLLLEEIFGINSKNELTSVRLGNYQMKYDNVNDTLDFLYNGVIGEPMEEIIPLAWVVGNLSGTDGSETEQSSTLRTGFVTIEDNYDYSFYLDTSMSDPGGIRVYFYDSNKTFISRTDGDTIGYITGSYNSIYMPNNAAYMRFKSNVNGTTTINNINSLFTLRKRKSEVNNYVREGLSMYIDANDVASYGSLRDITGKQNITNHGVSTTLDNGCLNFVSSESDYLDCGFKPNLTQWSAEAYFYYTSLENAGALLSWGASGNRTTISIWDSFMIAIRDDVQHTITSTAPTSLTHLVLTYNNGTVIAYVNGVKSQITASANVMSSQAGNLMIGTKYNAAADFASMHLKSLRFYDGKVLTDEEALQNYKYETKVNSYVREGLSMYIDADDVATYGSIRDITGKQNITNHGVSTTLDNGCLNFVSSESDYLDTGLVPNLTNWSAEVYFYFTDTPGAVTQVILGWGVSGNKIRIGYSDSYSTLVAQSNNEENRTIANVSNLLTLHHLIVTMNNGALTSYLDGVKTVLCTSGGTQTPHTGTLKIGTKYNGTEQFANIHLKSLRFYDGKVLSDKEVLQNYNYEINKGESIIAVTWNDGKSLLSDGNIVVDEQAVVTDYIKIDNNYNYTINYTDKVTEVRLAYYDNNNTFISRSDYLTSGAVDTVVEFPENTAYVRIKAEKVGITVNEVNDNIIFKKVRIIEKPSKPILNNYVTDGLSMYIDANDVATYGSVRDITGKQNITNHGVSTTLDNDCLNFVATESDYIDCGFKPNLTKWSLEYNFYLTELPDTSITMIGWGASGNRVAIGIWGDTYMIAINDDTYNRICTKPLLLSLVQVILTYDNGSIIAYVNGEKSQIATNANVMTSQAGNLMIGTKYNASSEFTDMHLKSLRIYDGKVLSDEEALQNYNYELNRDGNILSVTWNNNQYVGTDGYLYNDETSMTSNFISIDSKYNYTIYYTANVSEIRIVCYDSSQTLISRSDYITSGAVDTLMTFPENTGLIRIKATRGSVTVNEANANIIIKKVLK